METHPLGQGRGLEGNQERTQQPESRGRGLGGRGDFAAFAHQAAYLRQQEQTLPDHHQACLESSHTGFLSDRDFVPPHSGSDVAESSRHFLNYASLLEAPPDPSLQALLDPLPVQAHPESSCAGHSSESVLGPLPDSIPMYRSLQRYENYLRQDTYDRARPPEAFLRPFSSLVKAKKTIIQEIITYLDQRLRSNNEYLSTLQRQITDIENQRALLDKQLATDKGRLTLLKIGPRFRLRANIQQVEKQLTQLSIQRQEASHKYQQAEIKLVRQNQEYIQKTQELQQRLAYYHTLHEASNKYYPQREGQHSPSPDDELLKHLREYAWEPDPPAMINNRLLDNTIPGIRSNSLIHSLIRVADMIPPEFMAEASQEGREQLLQKGIAQNQMLTQEEITNVIHFLRGEELLDGRAVKVYSYIKQAVGGSVEPYLDSSNYAEALAGSENLDPIEIFFHQQTQHYSALLSETQGRGSAEKDLTAQNTTREDLYSSVASNIPSENVHINPQEITRENVHPSLAIDVPPQDRITNPPGTTFEDPSSSLAGSHREETHSSLAPFESKGTDSGPAPFGFSETESTLPPVDRSGAGPSSDPSHRRKRPSELPSNPEGDRLSKKRRTKIFEGCSRVELNIMRFALICSEKYLREDTYNNTHQIYSIIKALKIIIDEIIEFLKKKIEQNEKVIRDDPNQARLLSDKNQECQGKIEKLQQELNSYNNKYPPEKERQHSPYPDDDILKRLREYAWEPKNPPDTINNRPLDHTIPGIGNNCLIHSIMRASGETSPQRIQEAIQRARASLTQQGIAQEHPMLEQPQYTAIINFLRKQGIIDGRRAVRVYHYTNQKAGRSVEPYYLTSYNYAEAHPGSGHLDPIEIFLHQRTQHYSVICPETNAVFLTPENENTPMNSIDNIESKKISLLITAIKNSKNIDQPKLFSAIRNLRCNSTYESLKSRKNKREHFNEEDEKRYQEHNTALTCIKNIQQGLDNKTGFKEIYIQEEIKKLSDILSKTNSKTIINNSFSLLKKDISENILREIKDLTHNKMSHIMQLIQDKDNINKLGLSKAISCISNTDEYKFLKSIKKKGDHLNEEDEKQYLEYESALTCMKNIRLLLTGKPKGKEINLQEEIKKLSNILLETNIESLKTRAFLLL